MLSPCEQLRQEYENLKTLKAEFDLAAQKKDLDKALELKVEIEQKMDALQEKLWPFEALPLKEFKEQYESQKEILEKVGILEKLKSGEMGIKGIDNQEYAFPEYREIIKEMRENKEMLKTKIEQGFTELQITPFGMKLDDLIEKCKQAILKHHKEGKLFRTRKNPGDEAEALKPIELHTDCETNPDHAPLYFWDGYQNADISGKLVYFPKEFSKENHQGKTKKQILKETKQGFQIILREKNINIPRQGKGKTIGGRSQIDTAGTSIKEYIEKGKTVPSPEEYLKAIQTKDIYKNEEGQTPEDWLTTFLTYLEKYNQVIDDYEGNGSIAYNLGGYFFADGGVPIAYWSHDDRQASMFRLGPWARDDYYGARGRVRVK